MSQGRGLNIGRPQAELDGRFPGRRGLRPPPPNQVLSLYPVLKTHHTAARQTKKKRLVIARLTPTRTSAIS